MELTYVLELLKPTKIKADIIDKNIIETKRDRDSIANELNNGKHKLSSIAYE